MLDCSLSFLSWYGQRSLHSIWVFYSVFDLFVTVLDNIRNIGSRWSSDWMGYQTIKDARTRLPGRRTRVRRGGTRRRERDAADRASVPRRATLRHVADPNSGQRGPTRPKSRPSWPKSGRIGPYRPYRPATDTAEIGRENRRRGRNSGLRCVSCLILSLFCESSILMCFLRIF